MVEGSPARIRLSDVAARAGVSRTAAARVLLGTGGEHVRVGPDARRRILAAARALGYRPNRAAQQLRGAPARTLAVLMDTAHAPVMNERLAAIERAASRRGYRLIVGQVHGDLAALADYLADFDERGVEALFCLFDLVRGRARMLRPLFAGRTNVVFHGRPLRPGDCCVRVDTALAVQRLVEHLLARGHRRIGLALWRSDDELMAVRRHAFRATLRAHGRRAAPALIWSAESPTADPAPATLDTAVHTLVARGRADAVIASNDVWAARLIQTLKRHGLRVPQDVAVTGYDNLDLATIVDPALTTIDQQHALYAEAAVDLLCELAAGRTPAPARRVVTIEPRLLPRDSA